ncbi:MAG: hypothetical protein LBR10_01925 [Prevotellaceae bacterium]|jgi:hypothetical protein|nr:hypothetical protein [Prevotellaceae bacterium]
MKVFISGSIILKTLGEIEIDYLDTIIEGKCTVLIGDANGMDKAEQQYLAEQNYPSVIVCFSGDKVRNNIGNWQTKHIPNPENRAGRARYQLKDHAMADDCDSALMFWDGKSNGTKHNMNYLKELGKYYLFLSRAGKVLGIGNKNKMNGMIPF